MKVGCQSMEGTLRTVLVKHVTDAFGDQGRVDEQWEDLGFTGRPDMGVAVREYEGFIEALSASGAEVVFQPHDPRTTLDSLYAHDASLVTDRGIILGQMGKPQRRPEVDVLEDLCGDLGIPVLGRITGAGRLEGGDVCWLDRRTVAVGEGYRTNAEGIAQLTELLGDAVDRVISVPLPHWRGEGEVLHLLSLISLVDRDLAVVYPPLMPVPFLRLLREREIRLVEVPDDEIDTLGTNVLALGPRRCLVVEGNPVTRDRLEAAGAEVLSYRGAEISWKGCGGPTCLTRPLLRD